MEEIADIEAKLLTLTPRQCQVLYWICHGYRVKELARAFAYSRQTIHWDIGKIYDVFGLTDIKDIHEKRRILEQSVCPVHWKLVANPDYDCVERIFQKGDPLPPDPATLRMVKLDLDRGLLPLKKELEDPRVKNKSENKVIEYVPRNRGGCNWVLLLLVGLLGAVLVALVALIYIGLQLLNQRPEPLPPGAVSGPTAAAVGATPGAVESTVSPLSTPLPASTLSVPTAASTSPPQAAGCETYSFSDNFQGNLKPEWKRVGGESVIRNGRLGSALDELDLVIGNNLCNFTAEFDYVGLPCCSPSTRLFFVIGDKLAYSLAGYEQLWQSRQNDNWVEITKEDGLPSSGHIQLKVNGTDYRVLLNGKEVTQINYGTPQRAPFELIIRKGIEIDNFAITTQ